MPRASHDDLHAAVASARAAAGTWARADAYLRGQRLYRVAELLDAQADRFTARGVSDVEVTAAVNRWVWYAGWADKLAQVCGGVNPVAGPFFCASFPEPIGVVGVVAPADSALLGVVSVVAPVIVGGNVAVVVAPHDHAQVAIAVADVLAAADLAPGVVNVLTGETVELAAQLATCSDVDGLDLTYVTDRNLAATLAEAAADASSVVRPPEGRIDWTDEPGLTRMTAFLVTKTVWHPKGF